MEALEPRQYPSAQPIEGLVFYDKNHDNQFNSGESVFPGVTVFIDNNQNNHLDDGEDSTISDADGHYSLLMTSGWFGYARAVAPAGWVTRESSIYYTTGITNIFLAPAPSIAGSVYNDLNLDSLRQAGEDGISGATVFIDDNDNGAFDAGELSTVTDADGAYSFPVVADGQYFRLSQPFRANVRVLGLDGRLVLRPTSYIALAPDHSYTFIIATYQTTTASGVVFGDDNRNGTRDEGEVGIAGVGVIAAFDYSPPDSGGFVNFSNGYSINGVDCYITCTIPAEGAIVDGPLSVISQTTAENGSFALQNTPITDQSIALDSRFVRTSPDEQSSTQEIGALRIPDGSYGVAEVHGRVFDDLNNNGVVDPGEKLLSGVKIELYGPSQNPNPLFASFATTVIGVPPAPIATTTTDADGNFVFSALRQGDYHLSLDTFSAPVDNHRIDFSLNPIDVKTVDFPVHPYTTLGGKIVYTDGGYPRNDIKVYLDFNNNNKRDPNEPATADFDHGSYGFSHVPDGPFTVRVISQHSRLLGPLPSGVMTHAQHIRIPDIQMDHPFSTTPIRVYLDLNADGRKETSEPYLDKGLLQLDLDNNGAVDPYSTNHFRTSRGQFSFRLPWGTSRIMVRTFRM